MKRLNEGIDRSQATLFPERLDDYVGDDIVTSIKHRPNLLLVGEAKPLKMHIAAISESPRFRCKCH